MAKRPSVAEMFRYVPGQINLVGFTQSPILKSLGTTLGSEALLKNHRQKIDNKEVVVPSFPLQYTEERRTFLDSLPDRPLEKSLFDEEKPFPERKNIGSDDYDFLSFCEQVYHTLGKLKIVLNGFKRVSEVRRIRRRLNSFDSDLEETLEALHFLDQCTTFAVDTITGVIAPINEMPSSAYKSRYKPRHSTSVNYSQRTFFETVRLKMKKEVLNMVCEGKASFKKRIRDYVDSQFELPRFSFYALNSGSFFEDFNLRRDFEQLGVAVRLRSRFRNFMQGFRSSYRSNYDEDEDWNGLNQPTWVYIENPLDEISNSIYPQFSNHYDIQNLFPLTNLGRYADISKVVPINFKTHAKESKFLFAGLHSGGKSFYMENLVSLSMFGEVPLDFPADKIIIPKYNRIFYYRNPENKGKGVGKFEDEMEQIGNLITRVGKDDALFLDEMLDSTGKGVETFATPRLLKRLSQLKGTVFVSTHRNIDYKELQKDGWIIYTPEHKIINGKVYNLRKLKRGLPNERANELYGEQICKQCGL
jgi:hypothetical protein